MGRSDPAGFAALTPLGRSAYRLRVQTLPQAEFFEPEGSSTQPTPSKSKKGPFGPFSNFGGGCSLLLTGLHEFPVNQAMYRLIYNSLLLLRASTTEVVILNNLAAVRSRELTRKMLRLGSRQ